ncbi:MFS transporter [Pedococcus sp. P5_B7]
MSSQPRPSTARLPLVVFVLAAGTFLMGTTEFMIAGLLPEMAADLGSSIPHTGLLITAFAIGMIVGSPLMAVATLRMPQRLTLTLALLLFAAGHVVVALSTTFAVALGARVLTALATGAFWSVAAVVATRAAGAANSSRALGAVIGGLTLANVIGVPIGSFAGQLTGWRGPFWALAILATAGAAVIGRFIPHDTDAATPSIRSELTALRNGRLWLALTASAAIMGGVLATYSYITPILTERTGIPGSLVPLVLVGFGAGALAGTTFGGRIGDLHPMTTTITGAIATAGILVLFTTLAAQPVAAVVLVALMGLAGFAVNPVLSAMAVQFAGNAPTLAAALSTSAFNVGIAAGSWVAGLALGTGLGLTGPSVVGAVVALTTLVPLVALAVIARRHAHPDGSWAALTRRPQQGTPARPNHPAPRPAVQLEAVC